MKINLFANNIGYQTPFISQTNKTPRFMGVPFKALERDTFQRSTAINFKSNEFDKPNYCDTEQFSKYFEAKLRKDLDITTEADIEILVNKIAKKSKLSKKEVKEIISRLTQFSSYSQLPIIGEEMKRQGVTKFYNLDGISLHKTLYYAGVKKKQFPEQKEPLIHKFGIVLDNILLERFKKMKKETPTLFSYLEKNVQNNKIKLFMLDGGNVKDGEQYTSYGMFDKQYSLKDLTLKVVQIMKKERKNIDEALNQDFINDVKSVFGEEAEVNIIKNPTAKSLGSKDIAARMEPNYPKAEEIKEIIDYVISKNSGKSFKAENEDIARGILAKYYDTQTKVYSSENFAKELRNMHERIVNKAKKLGKKEEDIRYIIPSDEKSFSLIGYNYAKINNIPYDRFVYTTGHIPIVGTDLNDKITVVLDDFCGSGLSLRVQEFDYGFFTDEYPNTTLILAPLTSLKAGYNYIQDGMSEFKRENKDLFMTENLFDPENTDLIPNEFKERTNKMSDDERKSLVLGSIDEDRRNSELSSVGLPYMIPDNSSGSAVFLLSRFLSKPLNIFEAEAKKRENKKAYQDAV